MMEGLGGESDGSRSKTGFGDSDKPSRLKSNASDGLCNSWCETQE